MGAPLGTLPLTEPALAIQLWPRPLSHLVRPHPAAARLLQSRRLNMRSLNRPLQFSLPFCLRSACRAQSTHARRTHALPPEIRAFQVWTPPPRQALVPFHKSPSRALGVGRDGTPFGQACTASSGLFRPPGMFVEAAVPSAP
jgi:hypothetical protein